MQEGSRRGYIDLTSGKTSYCLKNNCTNSVEGPVSFEEALEILSYQRHFYRYLMHIIPEKKTIFANVVKYSFD